MHFAWFLWWGILTEDVERVLNVGRDLLANVQMAVSVPSALLVDRGTHTAGLALGQDTEGLRRGDSREHGSGTGRLGDVGVHSEIKFLLVADSRMRKNRGTRGDTSNGSSHRHTYIDCTE